MSAKTPVAGEQVQHVDISGGQVSYRRTGAGAPVVVLHPLALSSEIWEEFATRLAAQFDVIALDARGCGGSSWDGEPFEVRDMADDILAVIDALGLDRVHLIGMSMGGCAAITFAGLYPSRMHAMFLADTTAWYGEAALTAWEERALRVLKKPRTAQVQFQVDRWFSESFRRRNPSRVNQVVGVFLRTDSAAHAEACRAMGRLDSRNLLDAVTAPTLVVTGEEDYATPPEMGATIASGVNHGEARVVPGLRHLSLVEAPRLADLAATHLAKAEAVR